MMTGSRTEIRSRRALMASSSNEESTVAAALFERTTLTGEVPSSPNPRRLDLGPILSGGLSTSAVLVQLEVPCRHGVIAPTGLGPDQRDPARASGTEASPRCCAVRK